MSANQQSDIQEIVDILNQLTVTQSPDKAHEHENAPALNQTVDRMRENRWALTNTATIRALCDLAKNANDPFMRLIAVADLGFFGVNDSHYQTVTETFASIIANEPAANISHHALDALNSICHYRNDSGAAGKLLIDTLCDANYPHDLRGVAGVQCVIGQRASRNIAEQIGDDSVVKLIEVLEKESDLSLLSKVAGILSNTAKYTPAYAEAIAPHQDKIRRIGAEFYKKNTGRSLADEPQP